MKKYYFLIIVALILGLLLTGCSLLSNISQVPATEQSGISYIVKNAVVPPIDAFKTDLLAGQTLDVGDVLVWNDAENLYVKFVYEGSECGFLEVHLQVDVGSFSEDILTKKGNPIPGKFEKSYDVGCFSEYTFTYNLADGGFGCGDLLKIAAHAVVPSGGADVDKYAANVFSVTPGIGSVREPSEALGAPDSSYLVESFYSLGFGGCIELEFADFVGGTLTVYETTWHHFDGDTYPKESADIYVSADGAEWTYLGEANNDGQSWSNTPVPNVFTLEECIKYVKICDTSNPSLFGSGANAFDLDAIEGQYFCKKETAWGAGTRFVEKGNWATYFEYTVEGCPCILSTSENIKVLDAPPEDVRLGALEDNGYVHIWKEFEGPLPVGLYYDLGDGQSAESVTIPDSTLMIPFDTPVCIYYVHLDGVGTGGLRLEGDIEFGANIMGLIISGGNLGTFKNRNLMFTADSSIGDSSTTYPDFSGTNLLRGLEANYSTSYYNDNAVFNGSIVNFDMFVSNGHDSFRVIVPMYHN